MLKKLIPLTIIASLLISANVHAQNRPAGSKWREFDPPVFNTLYKMRTVDGVLNASVGANGTFKQMVVEGTANVMKTLHYRDMEAKVVGSAVVATTVGFGETKPVSVLEATYVQYSAELEARRKMANCQIENKIKFTGETPTLIGDPSRGGTARLDYYFRIDSSVSHSTFIEQDFECQIGVQYNQMTPNMQIPNPAPKVEATANMHYGLRY